MLRRDVMPATYDAALQERESILNGVRVDNAIPSHVLLLVLDPSEAVLESRRERVHVGGKLVRDNEPDVASNMPLRCLLKCLARKVGDHLKAEPSLVPLDHAEHVDSLRLWTPALGLSLNLRVVYLNNFVVQLPVETVGIGHRLPEGAAFLFASKLLDQPGEINVHRLTHVHRFLSWSLSDRSIPNA